MTKMDDVWMQADIISYHDEIENLMLMRSIFLQYFSKFLIMKTNFHEDDAHKGLMAIVSTKYSHCEDDEVPFSNRMEDQLTVWMDGELFVS